MSEAGQATFWAEAPHAAGYRPLLKWPGGKAREWPEIAPYLPERIRHFADPFMGGLAPFARTPFAGRAFLNDRHPRLVDVHRRVQAGDAALLKALARHGAVWQELAAAASETSLAFAAAVDAARGGAAPDRDALAAAAARALHNAGVGDATLPFVADSLADKARRVARLETKHDVHFDADAVAVHGETALRAGYYYRVRLREREAEGAQAAADFWFVREYCYGSMFRVNAAGEFNIPYGGASYNRKSFLDRVEQAVSPATLDALARATFTNGDFEPFLDGLASTLGADDFVFVDPPYHSDFSTYGPNSFSLDDHRRLAAALTRLNAPWLLVIKETPEVREIYTGAAAPAEVAHTFGKQYGYNVRGRNDRSTQHLVIRPRA